MKSTTWAKNSLDVVPFGKDLCFVQVINTAGLKKHSRKLEQYRNLEKDVNQLLPFGSIRSYRLIAGDANSFESGNAGDELRKVIARLYERPILA